MFGIEGLEDALVRLESECELIKLVWEDGEWYVQLRQDGVMFGDIADDLMDAYEGAWVQLKEWRSTREG